MICTFQSLSSLKVRGFKQSEEYFVLRLLSVWRTASLERNPFSYYSAPLAEVLGLVKLLFTAMKPVRCFRSSEYAAGLGECKKGLGAFSEGAIAKPALPGYSTLCLLMKIGAVLAHQQ